MITSQSDDTEHAGPTGRPVWLKLDPEPVYAVLHSPEGAQRSRTAALIVPPFGWEGECSYRARRDWAVAFAEAGVTTARFDLPGTEDSVGASTRPGRFQSWIDATTEVAGWLRERSGCERLVVVGIGLGGIVGYEAVVAGAPIDDLILWSVRASGRTLIREQQTFAAVAAHGQADARDQARTDGAVGVAGHRMSSETLAAISALDLTATVMPDAHRRRVLLIGRDSGGVDRRLKEHMEQSGADLTVLPTDEYRLLMMVPDMGLSPAVTIARAVDWCVGGRDESCVGGRDESCVGGRDESCVGGRDESIPEPTGLSTGSKRPVLPEAAGAIEFDSHGATIRERLLEVDFGSRRMFAVLAEPVAGARADVCLVSVNSAWLRRTGPNRIVVELTRRAAAGGIPAVRVDLPGLGDSEGSAAKIYERFDRDNAEAVAALGAVYDHLETASVASRFVSLGLCLGGFVAALSAVGDRRSAGFIGLNPQLAWVERQRQWQRRWAHELGAIATPQARTDNRRMPNFLERAGAGAQRWRARLESAVAPFLGRSDLVQRLYWYSYNRAYCRHLQALGESGVSVLLACGSAERLTLDVAASGPKSKTLVRWPNLRLMSIATKSHLFHPLWSQDELFDVVSEYLDEAFIASAAIRAEPKTTRRDRTDSGAGPAPKEVTQSVS